MADDYCAADDGVRDDKNSVDFEAWLMRFNKSLMEERGQT